MPYIKQKRKEIKFIILRINLNLNKFYLKASKKVCLFLERSIPVMDKNLFELFEIIESVNAIIWEYNIIDDNWDYVSPQSKTILGYEPDEWTGLDFWVNNIHSEDRNWAENYCLSCTEKGEDHIFEYRFMKKNEGYIWIRDEVVVIMEAGKPVKLRGFMTDITELKERENQIKYLLYKDSLTELYNRRFFEEEIKRLDTRRQLPLSIIMADVNGLKLINDSLGHEKGDQLLIKAANLLKEVVRDEDLLARQGEDEFAVLLPKTSNREAQKIVLRIKRKCRETESEEVAVSIGIGVATKTEPEQSIDQVLKEADNEMYQNKLSESRSTKSKIVQSLLNTLTAKSNETKEHAVRMTKLAFDFGEKLGLSNSLQHRLSLLATLHDIGKTTIPEEILKKPGKLTDKEWEIIKDHPERGYKIASSSQEFAVVADDIYAHHERWDGSGYPGKLKGENIPYLARIISIIDAYDVMTHKRSYKKAVPKDRALAEIKDCAGSQFDPDLAASFIELMETE